MMERDKPHLQIPDRFTTTEGFRPVGGGGGDKRPPFGQDRAAHGRRLRTELEAALSKPKDGEPSYHCVTFESFPGLELALESLEPATGKDHAELLAVKWELIDGQPLQLANVYIPDGKRDYFFKRLDAYVDSVTPDGTPKNANLVESISSIRRATIRELWTDPDDEFPEDGVDSWWEVWLRRGDKPIADLVQSGDRHRMPIGAHFLGFGDRTVALTRATPERLAEALASNDDVAELRRPHNVSTEMLALSATEQREWVEELVGHTSPAAPDAPAVCLLDYGVQQEHPLLTASLEDADAHVVDPMWRKPPVHGHGTEMAGLALYGDLEQAIEQATTVGRRVRLLHRLESVKFLPDTGQNDAELWGAVTARAVDRPEIQAASRPRVFLIAVTAQTPIPKPEGETSEDGKPTSWSASIDALAYGRAIDESKPRLTYLDRSEEPRPRLIVVSAGNIRDLNPADDHLDRSDLEPVEDPAQAWNALTVGAHTEKDQMWGAPVGFAGYTPIAPRGELSPVSRTSVTFDRKKWPFKPEVVAEGGNWAVKPGEQPDTPDNLALLTTRLRRPGQGYFTSTRDTSAASAQVAAIAADVEAAYPMLRPETVRGLIVHSAEWTDPMREQFPQDKKGRVARLRRYGMGVPDVARACRSAGDALTLVVESVIHPYRRVGNSRKGSSREMNLHELPWPKDELAALMATTVRLRVTLSYFVEPNPSSRGWNGRYVYPSHGLRFATKRADDTLSNFRKRINAEARLGGAKPPSRKTEQGWFFGSDEQQSPGSLHTDIWEGTAQALSEKGAIAVYPVAGWWKDRPDMDQSDDGVHYSLIVSVESPQVPTDLWTPVAQAIGVAVEIA
jgi:hypothetical protein